MSELITMDFGDTQLACWPGPHSTSPQGSQAVAATPPLPSTSGRSRCLLLTKSSQKTRGRKAGPHQHRQGHCGMQPKCSQGIFCSWQALPASHPHCRSPRRCMCLSQPFRLTGSRGAQEPKPSDLPLAPVPAGKQPQGWGGTTQVGLM